MRALGWIYREAMDATPTEDKMNAQDTISKHFENWSNGSMVEGFVSWAYDHRKEIIIALGAEDDEQLVADIIYTVEQERLHKLSTEDSVPDPVYAADVVEWLKVYGNAMRQALACSLADELDCDNADVVIVLLTEQDDAHMMWHTGPGGWGLDKSEVERVWLALDNM